MQFKSQGVGAAEAASPEHSSPSSHSLLEHAPLASISSCSSGVALLSLHLPFRMRGSREDPRSHGRVLVCDALCQDGQGYPTGVRLFEMPMEGLPW